MSVSSTDKARPQLSPVGQQATAVAAQLGVNPEKGLSADEVIKRLASYGPNRLHTVR